MAKRLLTKESAEILRARYDEIWDKIWARKDELMIAQRKLKKGKLPLEFHGRFITPGELPDIRARFKLCPERHPELIQAGKSAKIANKEVNIVEKFLENLQYPKALPEVAEVEDLIKKLLRNEKTG